MTLSSTPHSSAKNPLLANPWAKRVGALVLLANLGGCDNSNAPQNNAVNTGIAHARNAVAEVYNVDTVYSTMATNLPNFFGVANIQEAYSNKFLGHFTDQFAYLQSTFAGGQTEGAFVAPLNNTAPSTATNVTGEVSLMEGGSAAFAIGSFTYNEWNTPADFPSNPTALEVYLRDKSYNSALRAMRTISQRIPSDPLGQSVAYVQTQPDMSGNVSVYAFVRASMVGSMNQDASSEIKTYEYLAKQAERQFEELRVTADAPVKSKDGTVRIQAGSQVTVKKYLAEAAYSDNKNISAFSLRFQNIHDAILNPNNMFKSRYLQNPAQILIDMTTNFNDQFSTNPGKTAIGSLAHI